MKESPKLKVSPHTLRQLRMNSGFTVEELAKKLNVKPEKIRAVEEGKDSFTSSQLEKLAEIYKIPLVAFFTEEILEAPSLPDYRINRERMLGMKTLTAIRWAKYIAETVHELSEKRSNLPQFPVNISAEKLAEMLRDYLKLPKRLVFENAYDAWNFYRKLVEEKLGVAVLECPLDEDVRAFSIKSTLSVIVLNESDIPAIKVFSLFHELCHLLRDEEGICSIEPDSEVNDVERYCDIFAAEFLVPKKSLVRIIKRDLSDDKIWALANEYGVSKQVMMLRLLSLGYITASRYKKFKEGFKEEKLKIPMKKPQDWTKRYAKRLGSIVVSEVSKAYKRGDITFFEAADILNVKIKYAEKLLG